MKYWLADFSICLALGGGWLLILAGLIPTILILRGKVRNRNKLSKARRRWILVWGMVTSFVITGEVGVRLVFPSQSKSTATITLPDSYRESTDDSLRIAIIGGSTSAGYPYGPKIDIPNIVSLLIQNQFPDQKIHIDQLADVGINFRMAADRMTKLDVRPDVLIVYTGHNEFFHDSPPLPPSIRLPRKLTDPFLLRWSRFYQVLVALVPTTNETLERSLNPETILRPTRFTESVMRERLAEFQANLQKLSDHCRAHFIRTLWMLPAVNEGNMRPNRSMSARELSKEEEQDLNARFRKGKKESEQGNKKAAIELFEQLLEDYPDVAEVEFWLGDCYRDLGQFDRALAHLQNAQRHDGYSVNTTEAYRECITHVAESAHEEILDASSLLREHSPTGLLDRHVILDNVHPTLHGYYVLGKGVALSETISEQLKPDILDSEKFLKYEEVLGQLDFQLDDLVTAYRRTEFCFNELSVMRIIDKNCEEQAAQYGFWASKLEAKVIQPGEDGTESLLTNERPGVVFPEIPIRIP